MNKTIITILTYIIAILIGFAFGLWIPSCNKGIKAPPIFENFISSDTSIIKQTPQIYIGKSLAKGKQPIIPSIIMPTESDLKFNWKAIATIDSLFDKLYKDSVQIIYRDTQMVGNGNIMRLGFNSISRQFEPAEVIWNEQSKIITRTIAIQQKKWYEEPLLIGSTGLLLGFAFGYLIRK